MFNSSLFSQKRARAAAVLCLLLVTSNAVIAEELTNTASAEELLQESDRARGGSVDGLSMESTVASFRGDEEAKRYSTLIQADKNNSLVTFTAPAYSAGIKMLMQGRNMWLLSPDTKKPVPISPRQRLIGEASNGDIATTNYAQDYNARVLGEEKVGSEACYKLDLTAKNTKVTYDRIVYYIAKDSKLGIKAEYYTLSGKHFKTAYIHYDNELQYNGRTSRFASKMEIIDELVKGQKTVLVYRNPEVKPLPLSLFDKNALMAN